MPNHPSDAGHLIAPHARVHVRDDTTWRGRLLAEDVRLKDNVTVSAQTAFNLPSRSEDVVEDPEGGLIIVNEILINLEEGVPTSTLSSILDAVGGTIVGHIEITNEYKIRIEGDTPQELNDAIAEIEALGVEGVEIVSKNILVYPN